MLTCNCIFTVSLHDILLKQRLIREGVVFLLAVTAKELTFISHHSPFWLSLFSALAVVRNAISNL